MKIITKEEEEAHYAEVVRGGFVGGSVGLLLGAAGVTLLSRRYPGFRGLTLPIKAALTVSTGTFGAVVTAEHYGVAYQRATNPMSTYRDASARALDRAHAGEGWTLLRARQWARENRYRVVLSSWLAAMGTSFYLVGRSPYLTTAQKVVQARVYAQGLTLAILVATAALETSDARSGQGRWETVMVLDPDDPEHKHMIEKRVHKEEYAGQDMWKDMVAAEERRLDKQKKAKEAVTPEKAAPQPDPKGKANASS